MDSARTQPEVGVASEAIVVVDIVESTKTNNLFGWYAVGRGIFRDLRSLIDKVGAPQGLSCIKSTGDGYLVTFRNGQSAERAAVDAVDAIFELLDLSATRNSQVSEERALNLRVAVHFVEVDVVADDREGPNVSYAFRHESISRASLREAADPIAPEEFPLQNYVLCSEEVADILARRSRARLVRSVGAFRLKCFSRS